MNNKIERKKWNGRREFYIKGWTASPTGPEGLRAPGWELRERPRAARQTDTHKQLSSPPGDHRKTAMGQRTSRGKGSERAVGTPEANAWYVGIPA